jgi:SAM-dependent methyltransferase
LNARSKGAALERAACISWPEGAAPGANFDKDGQRLRQLVRAYVHHAPLALVLRELNRLLAIDRLPPAKGGQVLDVGCGDGFWWTLRERHGCQVMGVDIDAEEVAQAQRHIEARVVDVAAEVPFAAHSFDEIIGNCSLEHVPDLAGALKNLRGSAKSRARLVLFVPSLHWALHGRTQRLLMQRAPRVSMALAGALDGFFQHWHTYDVPTWGDLLRRSGWNLRSAHGLGNERSEFLFRLFLPQALPGFACKQAFGRYPNRALSFLPKALTRGPESLLCWALDDPLVAAEAPSAYEYMLVAEAAEVAEVAA